MPLRSFVALVPILLFAAACSQSAGDGIEVTVRGGDSNRRDCPVVIDLPAELAGLDALSLRRADTGAPVAIQRLSGEPPRAVFILDEPLAARESRNYLLAPGEAAATSALTATESERGVTLSAGDQEILVYNTAYVEPPEGVAPVFRSNGFIFPLYTPGGKQVTDDYPPDHLHQHGLFFAWTSTTFEGRHVDFWNQGAEEGTTEHGELEEARSGDVYAGFTTTRRYVNKDAPEGPKVAVIERWVVRAYALDGGYLIDLESVQNAASESPLTITEYHYGGMAVRGAREWVAGSGAGMLTSEGKDQIEGNHTRPNWVEIYGPVGGEPAGITGMGWTENLRHPQPVRLHPDMPYYCFSPMVLGEFAIRPSAPYLSRYRFWVHDGEPDPETNDRIWRDYADPLSVSVGE